jgi:uncharacterized membrane protein YoaK (UPF0700 family)
MRDRVVDKAAEYTTPARIAVRDWLLVALSLSTGIYEAIAFLSFGKVFTAFQTGNLVFLGVGLAGTRPPAGPNPVSVIISLAAFAVGAALAMRLLRASGAETDVEGAHFVWPRRVSLTLALALILQVVFLAVWLASAASTGRTYFLLAVSAVAMGMQMNAVRSLHVPGTSTTAFTATFISLVNGTATWSLGRPAARRLLGGTAAMAVGAYIGDVMLSHAHGYAPLVPVLIIAVVVTVATIVLSPKREPVRSPLVTAQLATQAARTSGSSQEAAAPAGQGPAATTATSSP